MKKIFKIIKDSDQQRIINHFNKIDTIIKNQKGK